MYQSSVRSATAGTAKTFLALFAVFSLLLSAFMFVRPVVAEEHDQEQAKVFVCKYVGTPGEDERLKDGKNPISVSAESVGIEYEDPEELVGQIFTDAQGRSLVIAVDVGQDEDELSACPVRLQGRIIVDKVVTGIDASTTEEFAINVTGQAGFTLTAETDPVMFGFEVNAEATYTVAETLTADQLAAGWTLTSIVCTSDLRGELGADFTVTFGETVTCVVTNAFEAPLAPGLLVVDKQVIGEGASTTEGFEIHVTGQDSFMLSADDAAVPFELEAGTTTAVSETLTTGQLEAGWSLVGIECTSDLDAEAVLNADALTIGTGETVTCVVTNAFEVQQQQRGQIGIFKTMCEDIGQQDTCMGRNTSLDNYSVDFNVFAGTDITADPIETATVVLSENAEGEGNTGNGSQGRILTGELEAGTYTVCEVPVAYLLDDDVRIDEVELDAVPRPESGNGGSTGGNQTTLEGTDCIVVEVTASGIAEVKFLDTVADVVQPDLGAIIVAKATVAPTDEEFAFEFDGQRFTLGSGDSETFDELPAGEYTVEELVGELSDDWSLEEIDCFVMDEAGEFPAAAAEISVTAGTAVIDLAEGQVVACMFLNEEAGELPSELGSITIVKVTVGAGGATTEFDFETTSPEGSDLPAEFSLMGGASRVFSGLDAGSYAFVEEVTAGWRLAALRCAAGGSVDLATRTATVTLEEGAAVTCVFTNVVAEGQLPGGPGPVAPKPREGQLPNTSALAEPSGSVPAALLALVMLTGLGAAGYAMQAEARRRR